jgi:hypothetical protein
MLLGYSDTEYIVLHIITNCVLDIHIRSTNKIVSYVQTTGRSEENSNIHFGSLFVNASKIRQY